MKIAVVGAGVLGAAVARELALRGVDVTVLERAAPGSGTTGTTFGWVNAHDKRPDSYHRLNAEACREHRRLAETPAATSRWYFGTGNLVWADAGGEGALQERFARLQALGYPCRWVDADEVEQLEPDVRLPPETRRVALFDGEGHVLPTLLLARLLGEARDLGAQVRYPVTVDALEPDSTGVTILTSRGERARYDQVVLCAGRWTSELMQTYADPVPFADPAETGGAAVGFLGYTAPLPVRLSRVLTTPRVNVRPDGGGRLVVQGLDLDARADPSRPVPDEVAARLAERLADVLGPFASSVESVRVGQRSLPSDGLPVVGYGDDLRRCYLVASHSGMTLAPLLGRLAASEVVDAAEEQMLAHFRPERFTSGAGEAEPARTPGQQ